MDLIRRIFFPRQETSSDDSDSKEDDNDEFYVNDNVIEGSYSNQRINLFERDDRNLPYWRTSKPTMMSEREVREIMHQCKDLPSQN